MNTSTIRSNSQVLLIRGSTTTARIMSVETMVISLLPARWNAAITGRNSTEDTTFRIMGISIPAAPNDAMSMHSRNDPRR